MPDNSDRPPPLDLNRWPGAAIVVALAVAAIVVCWIAGDVAKSVFT